MRTALLMTGLVFMAAACTGPGEEGNQASDPVSVATDAPSVTFETKQDPTTTAKPSGPVNISYRIVGEPVIGQPLAIDLQVTSTLGPQPVSLSYRINDSSALQLAESQAPTMTLTPEAGKPADTRQVRVIPLREGRLFLNVAASVETVDGAMSTVAAIPINVGRAPRDYEQNGKLETDEEGESVRVLSGEEN